MIDLYPPTPLLVGTHAHRSIHLGSFLSTMEWLKHNYDPPSNARCIYYLTCDQYPALPR